LHVFPVPSRCGERYDTLAIVERRGLERLALGPEPHLTLTYRDPITQARGYVVIDTLALERVFGGIRIAQNVSIRLLAPLARLGTIRYQLARVSLGGAKCGLDYDSNAPDRHEVLERFLRSLRPLLSTVLTLGPDLGVTQQQLEQTLSRFGASSRLSDDDTLWARYQSMLDMPTRFGSLRDVRVAFFAAIATQAAIGMVLPKVTTPRVTIVGVGPFGLLIARILRELGCQIIALANAEMGCTAKDGLSSELLAEIGDDLSIAGRWDADFVTYQETLRLPCDVLVFADGQQFLDINHVGKINAGLVIEAAQRSVSSSAEKVLNDRGISVVPNVAVSLGGIILADAIFVQGQPPESAALMAYLEERARATILEICRLASGLRITLRDAALRVAFRRWEQLPATWAYEDVL
jgi:glutamate dehydrogenase (NAD(P)+)